MISKKKTASFQPNTVLSKNNSSIKSFVANSKKKFAKSLAFRSFSNKIVNASQKRTCDIEAPTNQTPFTSKTVQSVADTNLTIPPEIAHQMARFLSLSVIG